jgi:L-threonylcarbamoyladenylate synthase
MRVNPASAAMTPPDPTPDSPATLAAAVACLRRGGVLAYPTEAVWGLGCDPFDEAAVRRLLALKQRSVDKGLILVAAEAAQLAGLVDWDCLLYTSPSPRDRG